MENIINSSTELVHLPIKAPVAPKTLFVSPGLPGDELVEWCERNSEKIEKILNEETTQYETKFD